MAIDHQSTVPDNPGRRRLSVALDFKLLSVVLTIIVLGMLAAWRPWQTPLKATDRTISVTGETTLHATPDEYVFSPTYDFTETDSAAALTALTAKSDDIVSKLKALGVPDKAIKSDSSGYQKGIYYPVSNSSDGTTYTLSITVTLDTNSLVQKVQDYLVTTTPSGSVSPTTSFSTAKQKALEGQARDAAEKDARVKADQSAKNLGFKVAGVKSVEDGSLDTGVPMPMSASVTNGINSAVGSSTLAVQPGQNDLSYSVSVVYYID